MKDVHREIKMINVLFCGVAVLTVLVGVFFSFLIAELDDAPGVVIIGSTISVACAACVYGLGKVLVSLRKNQEMLFEICRKLADKA